MCVLIDLVKHHHRHPSMSWQTIKSMVRALDRVLTLEGFDLDQIFFLVGGYLILAWIIFFSILPVSAQVKLAESVKLNILIRMLHWDQLEAEHLAPPISSCDDILCRLLNLKLMGFFCS